jgi:hypothetical protein
MPSEYLPFPTLQLPRLFPKREDSEEVELTPELQDSLIRSTGNKALSGLESVGNLIDVPASIARDTIGLLSRGGSWKKHNPFDQIFSPFEGDNRVYSSDLLEQWGLAGKRDTWGKWGTGLAMDIALDPLTYFGGIGALTKTGKALKAAGLLDNIAEASAKTLGRHQVGGVFKPVFGGLRSKMKMTGNDILNAIADPQARALALERFQRAGGDINELGEKLGSLTSLRIPGIRNINVGSGATAERVAKTLDDIYEAVRWGSIPYTNISPGRLWSKVFSSKYGGLGDERIQREMLDKFHRESQARHAAKEKIFLPAMKLFRGGLTDEDSGKLLRDAIELGSPADQITKDAANEMFRNAKEMHQEKLYWGTSDIGEMTDVVQHSERHLGVGKTGPREKVANLMSGADPQQQRRRQVYKGFTKGTNGVEEVIRDQDLHQIADDGINQAVDKKQTIQLMADEIRQKYGAEILPHFIAQKGENLRFNRIGVKQSKNIIPNLGTRLRKQQFGKAVGRSYRSSANDIVIRIDAAGTGLEQIGGQSTARLAEMDKFGWSPRDIVIHSVKVPKKGGGTVSKIMYYKPVLEDRYLSLAKEMYDNPQFRDGMFTNHPLFDMAYSTVHHVQRREAARSMYQLIADYAVEGPLGHEPKRLVEGTAVKDLLTDTGYKRQAAFERIAEMKGIDLSQLDPDDYKEMYKKIMNSRMPKEMADELRSIAPAFRLPEGVNELIKIADSWSNLFKMGVLTWPARYVRDRLSGLLRNMERGWVNLSSESDASKAWFGGVIEDAHQIPYIRDWLTARGLRLDADNGTDAIRTLYAMYGPGSHQMRSDIAGYKESATGGLEDILQNIPGLKKQTPGGLAKDVAETFLTMKPGTSKNPLKIRGWMGSQKQEFGPALAGDMVGRYTDDMNRIAPFIKQLRDGVDPHEAMREINYAQANYDPSLATPTVRQLKRLFPFWTFSASQVKYLANELMRNPGGVLGQTIRASKSLRKPGELMPDYVAETMSIPVGETKDGSKTYLTGLGMMHEDPLSFLGAGASGTSREILSRTHPAIKMAIELATQQALHQRGPMGGRPLEDMDPTWQRAAANIRDLITGERTGRIKQGTLGKNLEFILQSSPLARAGTTLRTATDPRKWEQPWKLAANLATGVRFSDISPAAQEALLRERTEKVMKDEFAAKQFLRTYIPKEELAAMSPSDRKKALQLKALINKIVENAQVRAAEAAQKSGKASKKKAKQPKLSVQLPKISLEYQ